MLARPHNFTDRPTDPERFYEMLVLLASGAAADRQYQTAYDIARQVDDSFAPGADISLKSYGIRDEYTTLTWLAGTVALRAAEPPARRGRACSTNMPAAAARCRSRPRAGTGPAAPPRRPGGSRRARRPISSAPRRLPSCSTASWRSSGSAAPSPPRPALPSLLVTDAQRAAFHQKRLVRAVRLLGQQGRRDEQTPVRPRLVRSCRQRCRPRAGRRAGARRSGATTSRCGPRARRATPARPSTTRAGLPDPSAQRAGGPHLVAGPRHHPPGKLVRPRRGQPRRRARHDAADARHRARAGRQDGRRL